MKKRIHGGWFIAELILVVAVVVASAQTTTPSWSGVETQQLLASCQTHNADSVVCVATDGVAFSYQGAAFVNVTPKPAPAPTFTASATGLPAGSTPTVSVTGSTFTFGIPAGAKGTDGLPGPVQSFGTNKCSNWSGGNSGVTESGCVQSTP
jgi:hypothetical protein